MKTASIFMDTYGYNLIATMVVAFLGILMVRNILRLVKKGLLESTIDRSLVGFVVTIIKIVLYVALLLYCLSRMNVPLTGIISALSAMTLAIGLAVQDIIGGVANGLMLVSSKLFHVNDYVDIGGISGSVKEIKLLHTVLVTPDNKIVTIPNKTVFGSQITNYSHFKQRRVDVAMDIDYDADVEKAKKVLLDLVMSDERILKEPLPTVVVKELQASSIVLNIRCWVDAGNFWPVTWFLNEKGLLALQQNNIEVPYNQLTISYREGAKS